MPVADTPSRESGVALFPDEQLAPTAALLHAQSAVGAAIEKLAVEPAGLDAGTADLLVRLSRATDHGIRGVDIGEQCMISAASVSRLVDRAEAAGLVERLPDPDDRRAQQVTLTSAGQAAAEAYAPRMTDVLNQIVFDQLTADERSTLIALLERIRNRAEELLTRS
jgi:DNA-binding MarR family transcriptional regulator